MIKSEIIDLENITLKNVFKIEWKGGFAISNFIKGD